MAQWHDITRDPEYQSLSDAAKLEVKRGFFDRVIAVDPDFVSLSNDGKRATFQQFMAVPDDTGEGYIRSLFGSAVRGAGEVVPGAIEGLGALTGIEPLEKAGRAIRSGLEYIAPVNPVQEGVGTSLANVAGNVVSMIGTGGVGGLTGKALAAERIAAGATAAERAALASQAIGKGAQAAMYGTTGLQGAASGAQAADQYGMTGGQQIGRAHV